MVEYYEDSRISQSQLKRFLNPNPRSLYRSLDEEDLYYEKEKIHFTKGKLLDCLLDGTDVDDKYWIEPEGYKHPTKVVESIAQQCVDENADTSRILEIKEEHGYQPRWTDKKNMEWLNGPLQDIILLKQEIGDKLVLSQEEYTQIATMAAAIKEGEYTKPILEEYPGEHQVALYTDTRKALIDYFQICHTKKVFRVIDYKTTYEYLEKFKAQIKYRRYDIQMSYYSDIAAELYPNYKMLEPVLIVASKQEPNYAEPFTLSEKIIQQAKTGWVDKYGNTHVGWEELLERANNYKGEMYNKELIDNKTNYINEL